MRLFVLNDVDYTSNITVPSYKVQSEAVEKTWEDATYTNHTDFLRWRIKGSFTIYFDDADQFHSFLDALENMRGTDNYIPATFYDNYKHNEVTSYFKITVKLINNLPYYQTKKHEGYEVTVEEK